VEEQEDLDDIFKLMKFLKYVVFHFVRKIYLFCITHL
jgi:hypothetical protein